MDCEDAMDLGLAGKHALVTGSTAGIGLAIARGLAAEGEDVVVAGRTQANVDAALKRIAETVPNARLVGIMADCATVAGAQTVFDKVPDLDILVNNLGIYGRKAAFEIEDAEWQRFFEVNVMGGVRFTRHYAPGMARRGWGRVVFVSSKYGAQHPQGDDPLRHEQDRPARHLARLCHGAGRHRRHCKRPAARTRRTPRTPTDLRAERAKAAGITVAEIEADSDS